MSDAFQTQVLIAGAGPIGMTAAIELARRGIACRIVDPLVQPPRYAKAVGVQPRTLGLTFEGAAFAEQYMLGDVEVGWSFPRGYGIRAMHQTDGNTDDLLVCIPLPGRGRYRMSMLVPDERSEGDTPQLHHLQAVLDRLSPEPTTARNLRWSSVFSISHRIVDAAELVTHLGATFAGRTGGVAG
jgi:hypothetical protein